MEAVHNMQYKLLQKITNDFSEEQKIGEGGFGTVYKGVLANGKEVAVKVLHAMAGFDDKNFIAEFHNLATLDHQNIVKLLGICNESEEVFAHYNGKLVKALSFHRALCLEYAPNGSLQKHISDENEGLSWHLRYKIIKGICEGLNYLHEGLESPIWHLDLKPDNILLDRDMEPKLTDFYLSRSALYNDEMETLSTVGTLGYMPPEYVKYHMISSKFDIYSLGVVITKIIVGQKGYINLIEDMSSGLFVKRVLNLWRLKLQETLKASLLEACCRQVKGCLEMAIQCMRSNPKERPTMAQIIAILKQTEIEQDNYGREVRKYSFKELKEITKDFSREQRLGEGGFGAVFRGVLEGGESIAVKRLKQDARLHERQFESEGTLKRLEHRNIVRLQGYCDEKVQVIVLDPETQDYKCQYVTERLLCYEFLPKGSLDIMLFGIRKQDEPHGLDWKTRYKIIEGICQGLYYLHEGCPDAPIVHRDLKPANILLDSNMVPKLGDFGLSRIFPKEVSHMKTVNIAGSTGYMAPEYANGGTITTKSDIFSLGIVIIEITTGERCIITGHSDRTFVQRVEKTWMVDSRITSMYQLLEPGFIQKIKSLIKMALRCIDEKPEERPTIGQIIRFLEDKFNNLETNKDLCLDKVRKMPFQLLSDITNNFSKERILADSNFAVVYKGVSLDGEVIAVTKFKEYTGQSEQQFVNQMNIARFEHTNIAQLVGYCYERNEALHNCENTAEDVYQQSVQSLLCYEFSSNGSLHEILHESFYELDWQTRYKIIEGICKGLHYLHEKCEYAPIVHMDLKSENIMIDKFMVPKLTNFGLSKLLGKDNVHINATTVVGSMGHMAPEYIMYGKITTQTDIYSLGMLIIEILTGEKCPGDDDDRKTWMKHSYIVSTYPSIEPRLLRHLERCIRIALQCCAQESARRPTAGKIIDMLQRDSDSSGDITEGKVRIMSFQELKDATNNFTEELGRSEIGVSAVYKGMLHDGKVVAVKKFLVQDGISEKQRNSELYLLRLEHKNIVQLKGYCDEIIEVVVFSVKQQKHIYEEVPERLLCYEFYPKGGLDKIIYGKSDKLVWQTRFEIIKGVCQGLLYLHEEYEYGSIVHMDIKPENILLTGDIIPKIISFGLSRLIPRGHSHIFDVTVRNSRGCMAPDYISTNKITTKLDIYSFGILIMEIVTGERCIMTNNDRSYRSFINNVQKSWVRDRHVASKYPSMEIGLVHQVKKCIEIGMRCVDISPDKRPTAREIITMLETECIDSTESKVKLSIKCSFCFDICSNS